MSDLSPLSGGGVKRKSASASSTSEFDPNQARENTIGVVLVSIADGQRGQPGRLRVGRFESCFQAQIPMP